MKILVWFFKFFAVLTTICLTGLIIYTSISYGVSKAITKDKLKDYMFNISYTDSSINNLINTYDIKDEIGYTDYLTELVVDKFFAESNFKKDMAQYLSDIIYNDTQKADKEKISTIVNDNINEIDKNNKINNETKTLMIDTVVNYTNDLIDNTIHKNEKTTRLLKIINHLSNVNISKLLLYMFGCTLLLIVFTISLIRPIKYIGISSLIAGVILMFTRVIEGPIVNIFIKGETTLLDASKTLINELFNHWFTAGTILLVLGIIIIIIYKVLMIIFDDNTKKKRKNKKSNKKKKLKNTIDLDNTIKEVKKQNKKPKKKI